jgi:hypothetical protein
LTPLANPGSLWVSGTRPGADLEEETTLEQPTTAPIALGEAAPELYRVLKQIEAFWLEGKAALDPYALLGESDTPIWMEVVTAVAFADLFPKSDAEVIRVLERAQAAGQPANDCVVRQVYGDNSALVFLPALCGAVAVGPGGLPENVRPGMEGRLLWSPEGIFSVTVPS